MTLAAKLACYIRRFDDLNTNMLNINEPENIIVNVPTNATDSERMEKIL